jgi:hypothetical protein
LKNSPSNKLFYKRSSFLRWLQKKKDCTVTPLGNDDNDRRRDAFGGVAISNHFVKTYMGVDHKDRIAYEEIHLVCNKLMIDGLPGESDLERAD